MLTQAGFAFPGDHAPVMAPTITAENAAAMLGVHQAFQERLLALHRSFADLARQHAQRRLGRGRAVTRERGVPGPGADSETIWVASASDGQLEVVLKRGMHPDLDAAHAAFEALWEWRMTHYQRMLRYFDPAR